MDAELAKLITDSLFQSAWSNRGENHLTFARIKELLPEEIGCGMSGEAVLTWAQVVKLVDLQHQCVHQLIPAAMQVAIVSALTNICNNINARTTPNRTANLVKDEVIAIHNQELCERGGM